MNLQINYTTALKENFATQESTISEKSIPFSIEDILKLKDRPQPPSFCSTIANDEEANVDFTSRSAAFSNRCNGEETVKLHFSNMLMKNCNLNGNEEGRNKALKSFLEQFHFSHEHFDFERDSMNPNENFLFGPFCSNAFYPGITNSTSSSLG